MNDEQYKERKKDKLLRDVADLGNVSAPFGFGETADTIVKIAIQNYLLTLTRLAEIKGVDVDILLTSVADEVQDLTYKLAQSMHAYRRDVGVH